MDSHKSLVHKRLESIQNSPTSSLRRKSVGQSPPANPLLENDDAAERIARRRETFTTPRTSATSSNSSNKRHSLGLGLLSNIPAPQMAASINECIKLNAENKINIKNAFSLEMIDFMTYMVKKQDVNMSNLQVASSSLDVSTKIYGYRVDSVHMEILKMVGGLDKQVVDMEQNSEQTLNENAEANTEIQKKKKKKAKHKIFGTVEALRGNIEIAKPMLAMIGEGDLQTSDMLYQAMLPNHANSGFYQHLYNDVIVDVLEESPESQSNSNVKYTIPAIEDFSNSEICASYSNFEFLGWSVDDEPEEMPEKEAESNDDIDNRFQFDLDASVEQDDEPAPEPMNYFDIEHDDDNNRDNVQACYRKTADRPEANVVEVHNVRASEYSFVQPSMGLHWAGPSHWKVWKLGRSSVTTEGSTKVACMQAKRKKKQFELLYDEARDVIDTKFTSGQAIKLHAKTAKAEWSAMSLTLPEDIHYDVTQMIKLYLYRKVIIKPANSREKEDGNDVTAADVSDGERYDYNNPNDTLEYCPNVEHDGDYDDRDDGNDDCHFEDSAGVGLTQGLVGDNLVAAPKLVNKVSIAYCLRAKKIDMRQLKKSIWNCLKSTNNNATNVGETTDETEMMKESKQFSDVYKTLPKLLTKSNAEALSVPISFISMLHLANEKGLKIHSIPDMSDIIIEPGEPLSN